MVYMIERERTFLIKDMPGDLDEFVSKEMVDMYIPVAEEHPCTRIRKNGDAYEFTKKHPINGNASQQLESTVRLTSPEYESLKDVPAKRISKTRYFYAQDGFNYEIDVFDGDLEGLVLVDIEFEDDESQMNFVQPEWCLVEVTHESFIAGGMLAGKTYKDIEAKLVDLGYMAIVR